MLRQLIALLGIFTLGAAALTAQSEPGPGDLIPRTGTLAYMTSDKPDVLYRMFGRDSQGGWKLRSFLHTKMEEDVADADPEEREKNQALFEYIFNGYESLAQVEIGLIDVTADGPKYLLHLKTKPGQKISIEPEFLAEFRGKEQTYKGVRYVLYEGEGGGTEESSDGDAEEDAEDIDREEVARPALGEGMSRFYVAATPGGVLVSNFETTIRDSIDLLKSDDYADALSRREEFKEWMASREPHDFSIFVIGREIQRAIERVLPDEEQVGMDADGVYKGVDSWLQFREYRYIVLDFDYDAAARGITIAGSFKTRRETKLLSKLAVEPGDFKMLKYVPEGSMFTGGMQLGDARQTFENLKDLARDAEGWAKEIEGGMRGEPGRPVEPWPDDESAPEDSEEMKSVVPGDALRILKNMQDAREGGESESEAEEEKEVDRAIDEIEEMLAEYGTSLDEIFAALGGEIVLFGRPNADRAASIAFGAPNMGDIMGSMDVGIAIAIDDVEKAKSIIANARENDAEGAFRGFTEIDYQGVTFNVSPDHPFGYAFTGDSLLVALAMGRLEDDATDGVIATLRSMVEASSRTTTGGDSFVRNGSKFIEFDIGAMSRLENELGVDHSQRLDRYAEPPLDVKPGSFMTDMTLGFRTREFKDGVEIAVRVAGLPDFGDMLESDITPFARGGGERNAYSYAEDNLRNLGRVLRTRVENDQPVDFDAMIEAGEIRTGTLQVPFDSRWQGNREDLGWTTLDQVERDSDGELPSWVDEAAAKMIEANEKNGFHSIRLAEGDVADLIANYKSGFIVAYQDKPETLGGRMVLYADGQVGWLHADVFEEALALNADDKPVPAEDPWIGDAPDRAVPEPRDDGERIKEDDPWFPGGR